MPQGQFISGSPCLCGHETTVEITTFNVKVQSGFIPIAQPSVLWLSKCSPQIPKFPSFYWNSVVLGEADREGRRSWVYSTLVGWDCSSWIHASHATYHPGKCCSFPGMKRLQGLEAVQRLRHRQAALPPGTAYSVPFWTYFHNPFPPLQSCPTLHCVHPWRKE